MNSITKSNFLISLLLTSLGFINLYGQGNDRYAEKIDTIESRDLEGRYHFRNVKTGQYLHSEPDGTMRMGQLAFQDHSVWHLRPESDGYYSIASAVSGRGFLTAQQNNNISQDQGAINVNKEWQVIQIDSTIFKFLSRDPNIGFITGTDTSIQSSGDGEDLASQWQLINTKRFRFENRYYLKSAATGKFLDSHASDALVAIHPVKRENNSIWRFLDAGDGYVMIDNVMTDRGPIKAFGVEEQVRYDDETALNNPASSIKWKMMYLHNNNVQFLNENTDLGYMISAGSDLVRTNNNYDPKEASWELIPAEDMEFDEPYYLRNVKTGQFLYASEDLTVQQQKSTIDEGSLWNIKKATDGFYSFDNSKENIGPLMAMPVHTSITTLDESFSASNDISREWQVIRIGENIYSFLSKDFNRGFITATDSGEIQNLPDGTDVGAQWELIKKSENTNTEIVIYPNPAMDNVTINFGVEIIQKVLIYTITGRLIYEEAITDNQSELLITQKLGSGTYMVQLINGQGVAINKRLIII